MLRSKTRSGSDDITQKNNSSSLFSRSKLCRGDVVRTQIDTNALKSIDKKPPNFSNISQNRADRIMTMQQQMCEMEEELRRTKEKFNVVLVEKHQILDQLRDANEALSPNKANELKMEVERLKKSLDASRDESKTKDKRIDSLESEVRRARELEAERNACLDRLNKELIQWKERENETTALLHENKKRIQELEEEIERRKELESKKADHTKTKIELEESRIEIISLREKVESLEEKLSIRDSSLEVVGLSSSQVNGDEEISRLKCELQVAQEGEKTIRGEMEVLKNKLKSAIEAEETSTKAMEELALALKEVATESNQAKEELKVTQIELEHVKGEAEQLKKMLRSTEETYQNRLHEAKQEAELHKNTADRLRVEAEETLLALNGKEMGFVSCIKRAEEERANTQRENMKLSESLKAAENMTRAAREETYKLRDILKQAVNEANAAKAAAGIARDENSLLKDALSEKDERLHFLTRENERLRISEAAANENMKQLKILLSRASTEFNNMEYNEATDDEDENESKSVMNKSFSFNLEDLKFMNEPEDAHDKALDEDPVKAEALKGSIFDANAETPRSEPRTPKPTLSVKQKRYLEDGRVTPKSEDFERFDDSDSEKGSHRRSRTMFQRVGDLLAIRRSYHRKEAPIEQTVSTQAIN